MIYILDSTAIRSGMQVSGSEGVEWYTTPSVLEEIRKGKVAENLELLAGISITVKRPGLDSLDSVRKIAEKTGDVGRLSPTDVKILALALELGGTILTDDYSIQNVAKVLGVEYMAGTEKGISEVYEWTWRCRGCGRYFDDKPAGLECSVCGSEVRTVRK